MTGKRATFHGFPWLWRDGDACVIRLVALLDPTGNYRLESGEREWSASKKDQDNAEDQHQGSRILNLSTEWGHGMPQWPSRPT